jgi:hypothetical protein
MNKQDFKDNPNWLAFYSSNGIVEVNFYPDEEPNETVSIDRLNSFIKSGLNLSTPNSDDKNSSRADFRLLDTFFSDSASWLVEIMDKAHSLLQQNNKKVQIQILLADPRKSFAKSRAKSRSSFNELNLDCELSTSLAMDKAKTGLRKIAESIEYFDRKIDGKPRNFNSEIPEQHPDNLKEQEIIKLIEYIDDQGEKEKYNLKVLFFSEVPSGPMFFLQNILIQGRFCYDLSSTRIPWMSIVNNPLCSYDFYDIFSMEFERIWQQSIREDYRLPRESTESQLQQEIQNLKRSSEDLKTQVKKLTQENKQLQERIDRFEN